MKKHNILVATPYPLFPANNGGRIHVVSSLKPVSKQVNLHLLAFLSASELNDFNLRRSELLQQYYGIFKSVNFIARPLMPFELTGKFRKLRHLLLHTFYGLPLMDVSFFSQEYVKKARELIDRYSIDIIEGHQLHMAFLKRFIPKTPFILMEQNREHELWPFWEHVGRRVSDRLWNQFGKFSRKFAYQVEVENSWKIEARCFISLDDMKKAHMIAGKPFWFPPAVELDLNEREFSKKRKRVEILWVGGFDWPPNAEGAIWFAKECWPILKPFSKKFIFHFIGSNPPAELTALHDGKNVLVHGFLADIEEYWHMADVFIVPLRSGGGIRIKIVEALNAGIPVVSTPKGCNGIPYEPGIDLLVADDPINFSNAILRLAKDPIYSQFLSRNGRTLVQNYFSLEAMGSRKMAVYQAVSN
jgi:glycosyltransferase involved in cell wall biosynthesis